MIERGKMTLDAVRFVYRCFISDAIDPLHEANPEKYQRLLLALSKANQDIPIARADAEEILALLSTFLELGDRPLTLEVVHIDLIEE